MAVRSRFHAPVALSKTKNPRYQSFDGRLRVPRTSLNVVTKEAFIPLPEIENSHSVRSVTLLTQLFGFFNGIQINQATMMRYHYARNCTLSEVQD
jgi:hypothetical protein